MMYQFFLKKKIHIWVCNFYGAFQAEKERKKVYECLPFAGGQTKQVHFDSNSLRHALLKIKCPRTCRFRYVQNEFLREDTLHCMS